MEKYIPCKWKQKKAGVSTLISDKTDLKINKITRDKEGKKREREIRKDTT